MSRPRQRSIDRSNNCRRLIEEIRTRDLSRDEIGDFLAFSPSGARKYIVDLVRACVIIEVGRIGSDRGHMGQGLYTLGPAASVELFLERSLPTVRGPAPRKARSATIAAMLDPQRHIHLMQDDIAYRIAPAPTGARVDPLALPEGFFKPSPDFVERRQAERAAAPALTGFAALDVHFSRNDESLKAARMAERKRIARARAEAVEADEARKTEAGELAAAMHLVAGDFIGRLG